LNLGLVGLFLLIALLIATFWKARRELLTNFQFGRFRLGFLMAVIAYKLDRGSFQKHQCNLFVFYLVALDYRQPEFHSFQRVETVRSDEDEKLIYAQDEIDASPSGF
jgi:hypothetical protein